MSEQNTSPRDLEREVILRALKDPAFRAKLLADPREAIESVAGVSLPESVQFKVIEAEPNTLYLVLPRLPEGVRAAEELSEADLAQIAAGIPSGRFCQ